MQSFRGTGLVVEVSGYSGSLPVTQVFQDLPNCVVSVEGGLEWQRWNSSGSKLAF